MALLDEASRAQMKLLFPSVDRFSSPVVVLAALSPETFTNLVWGLLWTVLELSEPFLDLL